MINWICFFAILFSALLEGKPAGGVGGGGGGRQHGGGVGRGQSGGQRSIQRSVPSRGSSNPQASRQQVQQFMRTNTPQRGTHAYRDDARFQNVGNRVRNDIGNRGRYDWFNNNFWARHNYRPAYYGYNDDWWYPATAVGISGWLGWQNTPYYYSDYDEYGYGTFPVEDSYVNYAPLVPVPVQQPQAISSEWMPLGVFAVAKGTNSVTEPTMFLQLALKKNGEIAGTYYNSVTDQNYEVEGMVNSETQLAVWKISNNTDSPVFQAGVYNLSQDEAPVRIHFQNNTTQDWLLVRLQN